MVVDVIDGVVEEAIEVFVIMCYPRDKGMTFISDRMWTVCRGKGPKVSDRSEKSKRKELFHEPAVSRRGVLSHGNVSTGCVGRSIDSVSSYRPVSDLLRPAET